MVRNMEILYGRGLVQKGYRRVPNTFYKFKLSNIQEKKCQVVHRDPKHSLFTNSSYSA